MLIFLTWPSDFLAERIVSKETQHYLMINLRNLRQCPAGGFSFSEQLFFCVMGVAHDARR